MNREQQRIGLFQSGDKEAFGCLVQANMKRVYGLAYQMMHNHAAADEISQETFVKAFESIGKFKGDSVLFTWLYRITVNLCLEQLGKNKRNIPLSSVGDNEENN